MKRPLRANPHEDAEFRSAIISLLKMRKGVGIDLFGLLAIDDMENGHVRVLDQRDVDGDINDGAEYVFKDVKEGVCFFLHVRKERGLGFDFDRKRTRNEEFDRAEKERLENQEFKIYLIEDVVD